MNKLDELLKLKELLDLGIITDKDFNRKKTELLSEGNTGYDNSDSIKEDEIIGENEKECPTCKFIIDKESEVCKFCDYDFINNKISNEIDIPIYNNLKKYISILFIIIIFIIIGTWFFTQKNTKINSEIELKEKPIQNELVKKDIDKKSHTEFNNEAALNNKFLYQKIRNNFEIEKKLFFIEKNKKEIAYEITLKKDTIVFDLNYKLAPSEESSSAAPDSDGYYSRYANICLLKNGEIFDFGSNGISYDYIFINNTFYVKNFETKKYEEYVIKSSKSNCKVIDILLP